MSISFVRVQHTHTATNSTNVGEQLGDGTTVPAPVNGDLGLFILANNKGSTDTVTGATGWTNEIPRFNPGNINSSSPQGYMDYRFFSNDSGALPVWTLSVACEFVGTVLEYAGVDSTTPFDVIPITNTTGAASLSGLSTVTDGCILVYAAMYYTSTELWSADQAGWNQRVLANDGASMRLYIADYNQATHGSSGTVGPTWSTAPTHIVSALFALRPASTTPTLNLTGARGAIGQGVSRFGQVAQNILGRRGAHILAASRFGAVSTTGASALALKGPRGAIASTDSRVGRLDVDYQEKPSGFLLADSRPGALTTNASVLAFTGPKTASALGAARFGTLTKDTTGRLSLHGPANLFLLADGRAGTLTTNTLQLVGARGAEAWLDTRPSWLLEASTRAGVVTLRTENAAVVTLVEAQ